MYIIFFLFKNHLKSYLKEKIQIIFIRSLIKRKILIINLYIIKFIEFEKTDLV